ncbi:MAG: hypothetical protein NTW60_01990 [Candidatus Wolfebacteria bacterium]|nr:hypothetical protein [Candidatus Wolfebacteria bacterium]
MKRKLAVIFVIILAALLLCPASAGAVSMAVSEVFDFIAVLAVNSAEEIRITTLAFWPSLAMPLYWEGCVRTRAYYSPVWGEPRKFRVTVLCAEWPPGHIFSPQRTVTDVPCRDIIKRK